MNRVALVVPYFGKLPDYFNLFLKSCEYNKNFNWIFFIDDKTEYNYPDNVKVHYTNFSEIQKLFNSHFNFVIRLDQPYKLCDFRPTYGLVFQEFLENYEFWGHCDIDVVFGNISKFVTDDILNQYEKIYFKGHFSLYRNNEKMNNLFKTSINEIELYRKVLSNLESFGFDEGGLGDGIGMYTIFQQNNIVMYEEPDYASLDVTKFHFQLSVYPYDPTEENLNKNSIFLWEKGAITRYYIRNNNICNKEYLYLHMQARNMKLESCDGDSVIITPNEIKNYNYQKITNKFLKKTAKHKPIYLHFWIRRFNRFKKNYKNFKIVK